MCISIWHIGQVQEAVQLKTVPGFYILNTANSSSYIYPTLPPDDYSRLINLTNFKFIMSNDCEKNTRPLLLLVLVHSSPTNYAKRQTIRETWGQNTDTVKVVFMLGSVKNESIMNDVYQENELYQDIAQGNFVDSYRNMTYKHVMVFKYAIYNCPHAKYVLKTDDDVFVNMPRMIDFLNLDLSPYGASNLLFCTPYRDARVMRSYRSKWRVGFHEYPDKYYPAYCPGWALLYSPDVLFGLYKKVQKSKYFWIDDVLITGTLAKELQIEHTDFAHLTLTKSIQNRIVRGCNEDINSYLYGTPDLTENEVRILWKHVEKNSKNKSVLQNMK